MKGIIKIASRKKLLGIIIKADFRKEGIEFFTPNDFSQQLAYMQRPKGYIIAPHIHTQIMRVIKYTKETLFIKSGKVRIDFYDNKRHYVESRILSAGDTVFLAAGGHGFEFIEDAEMIEIKQGPYTKKTQSVKFNPIPKDQLKVRK